MPSKARKSRKQKPKSTTLTQLLDDIFARSKRNRGSVAIVNAVDTSQRINVASTAEVLAGIAMQRWQMDATAKLVRRENCKRENKLTKLLPEIRRLAIEGKTCKSIARHIRWNEEQPSLDKRAQSLRTAIYEWRPTPKRPPAKLSLSILKSMNESTFVAMLGSDNL